MPVIVLYHVGVSYDICNLIICRDSSVGVVTKLQTRCARTIDKSRYSVLCLNLIADGDNLLRGKADGA